MSLFYSPILYLFVIVITKYLGEIPLWSDHNDISAVMIQHSLHVVEEEKADAYGNHNQYLKKALNFFAEMIQERATGLPKLQ